MELPVSWANGLPSLRRSATRWMFLRLRLIRRGPCRSKGVGVMGWTLGRYFFFRYATITTWFFLGVFALVFLIDFTELSGRTTGLPGFTYRDRVGHFGASGCR